MTRFRISLSIGAAALGLILAAGPAVALNLLSFVQNDTGNDTTSCSSPAAPCAGIDGALAKTEPGGVIKCLDNHREAIITIAKPITIDCDAPGASLLGLDAIPAITVNVDEATFPNGVVTLRNLTLGGVSGNGLVAAGTDGIRVMGGGAAVHIENVTITGFAEQGIDFRPTSSVDLFVRNTIISNNRGGGVSVAPVAPAGARGSLSHVSIDGNGGIGVAVTKTSGVAAVVTVEDTRIERIPSDSGPAAPARSYF